MAAMSVKIFRLLVNNVCESRNIFCFQMKEAEILRRR